MSPRTLAGSGALLLALAAPAAASAAPTMQPLKPCYVTADTTPDKPGGEESEGIDVAASGFAPNASIDLTIDGAPYPGGTGLKANNAGELPVGQVPAPFVKRGSRTFTLTLTEQGNPANTVSATAKSTSLGVSVKPKEAHPSDRIRFKGLGFTEDKAIYAHYVYKGKLRKTVRMARKPRACGGFKTRRRQIPIRRPGLGDWTIQFDQSRRYIDPAETPIVYVQLDIRIRRVPR